MNNHPSIVVTSRDFERLYEATASADGFDTTRLEMELERARVVDPREAPPNLVTMNSVVTYKNSSSGELRTVRLVYPRDADVNQDKISVVAPLGTALLGLREGQEIEWLMPGGHRKIAIEKVVYQPEAAGHWDL